MSMNKNDIESALKPIQEELDKLAEEPRVVTLLVNFSADIVDSHTQLTQEIQALQKRLNKLEGKPSQPTVRQQTTGKDSNSDHSSEDERKKRNKKKARGKGGSKKSQVKVDRTVELSLAAEHLPPDAIRDGIQETVIQDLQMNTDNILFKRQRYYSKKENRYYLAPLPTGYEGEYGPTLKSWANVLYSEGQMTTEKITGLFTTAGLLISKPTVHGFIMSAEEAMSAEKRDIMTSGLASTSYQHLDDTSAREKGQNRYVNVLGNEFYSAYCTLPSKDRLSIIEMLCLGDMKFTLNEQAFALMVALKLPQKYRDTLKAHVSLDYFMRDGINNILEAVFTNPKKHKRHRKIVLEACAIAAYQQVPYAIQQLIVDDAPQFKLITQALGLCWIHEGRHYKKLYPVFKKHVHIVEDFIGEFWDYYYRLLKYKENPSPPLADELRKDFYKLFSRKTGYDKLDKQIALTLKKVDALLLVLLYPHIPVHNNPAELMARYQARSRDVHLHTMSDKGTSAKDALATVTGTAKKLSVNLFDYIYDRITKRFNMISLADLITIRATAMASDDLI